MFSIHLSIFINKFSLRVNFLEDEKCSAEQDSNLHPWHSGPSALPLDNMGNIIIICYTSEVFITQFITPEVDVREEFEIPEIDISDVPEVFDVPEVYNVPDVLDVSEVYPEMSLRFYFYVMLSI